MTDVELCDIEILRCTPRLILMTALALLGEATLEDLATITGLSPESTRKHVEHLIQSGLVRENRGRLCLTERGMRVLVAYLCEIAKLSRVAIVIEAIAESIYTETRLKADRRFSGSEK